MFADSGPDTEVPHGTIFSLNNIYHASYTRDLADYLALFLVIVLGLFRLDAVMKRFNIGIRMTQDVGTETENISYKVEVLPKPDFPMEDEVHNRDFRDFGCNTHKVELNDQACNTDTVSKPIVFVVTAPSENRYTDSGTNTEAEPQIRRKTFVSEFTQTNSVKFHKGGANSKGRSKIPVLLKTMSSNRNQTAPDSIVDSSGAGSDSSTQSIPELPGGIVSPCQSPKSSSSPSDWDHRVSLSSTGRSVTPDVQLEDFSKMYPKSSLKPDNFKKSSTLKKSSTWSLSDRYRYCDSSIRNDVLLRSPKLERSRKYSVIDRNPLDVQRTGKCVRKCKSFGGEVTEYNENLSPQNFVFNPRLRHQSNRRLYRVTYVAGS